MYQPECIKTRNPDRGYDPTASFVDRSIDGNPAGGDSARLPTDNVLLGSSAIRMIPSNVLAHRAKLSVVALVL